MKIIIIADEFAPQSTIAAVRPTKLYKYWKRAGHTVHVLTPARKSDRSDALFASDGIDNGDILAIKCDVWLDVFYHKLRAKPAATDRAGNTPNKKGSGSFKQAVKKKILRYYNAKKLKKWQRAGKRLLKRSDTNYDLIFSTYGPEPAHQIGVFLKKRNPAAQWIADFRDPPVDPSQKIKTRCPKKLAGNLCASADLVTAVSKGCLKELFLPDTFRKEVITNGYDPDDNKTIIANPPADKLVFAYTGQIYRQQTLKPFFRALRQLIDEGKIDENKIALHYAGWAEHVMLSQAKEYGMESHIRSFGRVSREQSMQIQADAHVLLLAAWNTADRQGIIGGKIYEYLLAKKPIIGSVSGEIPNSEMKEIIDKTCVGFCYEQATDDFENLRKYILNLYNRWTYSETICYDRNEAAIAKYNYENIAQTFLEIIKQ